MIQPIIPSNLKKARFIPIILIVFAMSESPKFHHVTKKKQISYQKKERSVGIAKHSIFFQEHGEEVPVCENSRSIPAAQEQHSSGSNSSTAEAAAAAVMAVAARAA